MNKIRRIKWFSISKKIIDSISHSHRACLWGGEKEKEKKKEKLIRDIDYLFRNRKPLDPVLSFRKTIIPDTKLSF